MSVGDGSCPICFESIENTEARLVTSCGHSFHYPCIAKWLRKGSCPVCRSSTWLGLDDDEDGQSDSGDDFTRWSQLSYIEHLELNRPVPPSLEAGLEPPWHHAARSTPRNWTAWSTPLPVRPAVWPTTPPLDSIPPPPEVRLWSEPALVRLPHSEPELPPTVQWLRQDQAEFGIAAGDVEPAVPLERHGLPREDWDEAALRDDSQQWSTPSWSPVQPILPAGDQPSVPLGQFMVNSGHHQQPREYPPAPPPLPPPDLSVMRDGGGAPVLPPHRWSGNQRPYTAEPPSHDRHDATRLGMAPPMGMQTQWLGVQQPPGHWPQSRGVPNNRLPEWPRPTGGLHV